jgi:hypothetical protein
MYYTAVRRQVRATFEQSQLLVLRRVIDLNRTVARARRWLKPVEGWLWMMPAAFLIGMFSVMVLRLS